MDKHLWKEPDTSKAKSLEELIKNIDTQISDFFLKDNNFDRLEIVTGLVNVLKYITYRCLHEIHKQKGGKEWTM